MLFGLGVIGGLKGPDLGVNAPNINGGVDVNGGADVNGGGKTNGGANENNNNGEVTVDGVKYPSSSVIVETEILKKEKKLKV